MKNDWWDWVKFITPIMVTITLFVVAGMNSKIDKLDEKMFKHFTNSEVHAPTGQLVTRSEFIIYQSMRDKQMLDIKEDLTVLKHCLIGDKSRE